MVDLMLQLSFSEANALGHPTSEVTVADNLTISDSGDTGITLRSGTSSTGSLYFSETQPRFASIICPFSIRKGVIT